MKIGLIGLGKMGYNLSLNLMDNHHEVVAYDVNKEAVEKLSNEGATGAFTVEELVNELPLSPKVVWIMVPAGEVTENVITELKELLSEGDIIIDGGNSNYKESVRRAQDLQEKGIYFFDVGTSGGMEGARNGACTMIGGDAEVFRTIEPIFNDICVENGFMYAGKSGSGHFLKMVHNGVEYGMMQSIAEGFEVLEKVNLISTMKP